MSESNVNPPRSPSPEDNDASSKRRRFDPSSLETPSDGAVHESAQDSERIQEKFTAIYRELQKEAEKKFEKKIEELGKLVQSKDRALVKLRLEEEKMEQENAELREDLAREKSDKQETMARLQQDLTRSNRETEEARRAQAVAEEKLLQHRAIIERQYNEWTPLMINSSPDGVPAALQSQEELQASASVGKPSDTGSTSLDTSNLKNIQLKEARVIIQTMTPDIITHKQRKALEARAKRADELEEELRVAQDTISSLHEALRERQATNQARELQEQGGWTLQSYYSDGDEIGDSFNVEDSPSEASDETYAPLNDRSENNEGSVVLENEEQQEDPRVLIGKKYLFFVSGSQFLKIHWEREYEFVENYEWVCKRCPFELASKQDIQDHVWIKHYEGYFQCPHCSDPPVHFLWRKNIPRHMKNKHPQLSNV